MMSAESPVRVKVTDWPAAASCTNFDLGPPVFAVLGLPASVVGHVNDVSPVDTAPMNPRPPPVSPCVGYLARSMSLSRATHRFSKPENGGPLACTPSVIESPRQTTLQLADIRLDNPANQGVSDLDC
jgi:hypothetical protein